MVQCATARANTLRMTPATAEYTSTPRRSFGKPALATVALFFGGSLFGWQFATSFLRWLGAPFGQSLVVTGITESFRVAALFGLSCGVLTAAAPIAALWIARSRWPVLCGLFYLMVGGVFLWLFGFICQASFVRTTQVLQRASSKVPPIISVSELSAWRLPIFAAAAIILLSFLHRAFVQRTRPRPLEPL